MGRKDKCDAVCPPSTNWKWKGHNNSHSFYYYNILLSLNKTFYPLLSTGNRKTGKCPDMTEKLLAGK